MTFKRAFRVLAPVALMMIQQLAAYSVSSSGKMMQDSDELTAKTSNHQQQQQQQNLFQMASMLTTQSQHQTQTTLPPLITTLSFNNYIDSLANSKQAYNQQNMYAYYPQQNGNEPLTGSAGESGNNGDNAGLAGPGMVQDEAVPAATTINNHSRNNQQAIKPPQYVDVSGLMSRDRNLTNSSSGYAVSGTSGLTAKSHFGLPECATQQVCNALFVKMNYTQRLCECSSGYNWKCSSEPDERDGHTIELTRKYDRRIYTQIKTCEPLREVRACKSPTDWTLLALQSERSGKAHYVVVCKCPIWATLEGPYTHNHPPYANIPGIRVYGMLCAHQTARSSGQS